MVDTGETASSPNPESFLFLIDRGASINHKRERRGVGGRGLIQSMCSLAWSNNERSHSGRSTAQVKEEDELN